MDYALDLLIPILGAIGLAQWLINSHQWPLFTMVWMPIVGLFGGLGLLYKRQIARQSALPDSPPQSTDPPENP
jgi:hypothetical protein